MRPRQTRYVFRLVADDDDIDRRAESMADRVKRAVESDGPGGGPAKKKRPAAKKKKAS